MQMKTCETAHEIRTKVYTNLLPPSCIQKKGDVYVHWIHTQFGPHKCDAHTVCSNFSHIMERNVQSEAVFKQTEGDVQIWGRGEAHYSPPCWPAPLLWPLYLPHLQGGRRRGLERNRAGSKEGWCSYHLAAHGAAAPAHGSKSTWSPTSRLALYMRLQRDDVLC